MGSQRASKGAKAKRAKQALKRQQAQEAFKASLPPGPHNGSSHPPRPPSSAIDGRIGPHYVRHKGELRLVDLEPIAPVTPAYAKLMAKKTTDSIEQTLQRQLAEAEKAAAESSIPLAKPKHSARSTIGLLAILGLSSLEQGRRVHEVLNQEALDRARKEDRHE